MGAPFELVKNGHVSFEGEIRAPGATPGDVLTVNADESVSPAPGGGSQPLNVWLPDAPPASPNADDQEYAAMTETSGVPAGWTAYDPTDGSLDVSITGPGLAMLRTDSFLGAFGPQLTGIGPLFDNGTFDVSASRYEFPSRIDVSISTNGSGADISGVSIEVTGTDLTGAPQAETLGGWTDGVGQTFVTVWGQFDSIIITGATGLTGAETILASYSFPITRTLCGIYKADPGGDLTIWTKLCSAKDSFFTSSSISGIAFFEDATDFTKKIAVFGHHWFGDSAYGPYSDAYTQDSFSEGDEVQSQYIRTRRNGTDYWLDVSVGGLAFTTGNPAGPYPPPIDIGFVPAHVGLVMDLTFQCVFEFLRFVNSDVTLFGVAEGARA
jgi:hypothetical protein